MDIFSSLIYNFCMMPVMVKEADLDQMEVPEDYEVLDATALGSRLGVQAGHGAGLPVSEEFRAHTSP